jgi:hypothetical protein
MKTWFKELWAKIKVGITNLYKNSWFNLLSVLAAGFLSFGGWPGMVFMLIYFLGWALLAEK